jgi:hypothetical protein
MMNGMFGGMMAGIGGFFSFMARMMQAMFRFMFGWL